MTSSVPAAADASFADLLGERERDRWSARIAWKTGKCGAGESTPQPPAKAPTAFDPFETSAMSVTTDADKLFGEREREREREK